MYKNDEMELPGFIKISGVYMPDNIEIKTCFEENYINIREKEKRIYTDEDLKKLPVVSKDHIHYKEWQLRKQSADRFTNYLFKKSRTLKILEIGCGNGWLSNFLTKISGSEVTGIDINLSELRQGARIFNYNPQLLFVYGDIRSGILQHIKYDIVIFAASVQYFPAFRQIINTCLSHLNKAGEIHIIDAPFYEMKKVEAARRRTTDYYTALGVPAMANNYFHHCINDLKNFNYRFLYNPGGLINKLKGNHNPFPWIMILNS